MKRRLAQASMGLITAAALALIWLTASLDPRVPTLDGRPLVAETAAASARR